MAADVRIGNSVSRNVPASGFGLRDDSCSNRMLVHGG
jgi:hypothetical protein